MLYLAAGFALPSFPQISIATPSATLSSHLSGERTESHRKHSLALDIFALGFEFWEKRVKRRLHVISWQYFQVCPNSVGPLCISECESTIKIAQLLMRPKCIEAAADTSLTPLFGFVPQLACVFAFLSASFSAGAILIGQSVSPSHSTWTNLIRGF